MIWIIPNRNRSRPKNENVEGEAVGDGDEERTKKMKRSPKAFHNIEKNVHKAMMIHHKLVCLR